MNHVIMQKDGNHNTQCQLAPLMHQQSAAEQSKRVVLQIGLFACRSVRAIPGEGAGAGQCSESKISLTRPVLGSVTMTEQLARHCTSKTSENKASWAPPSFSPISPHVPAYVDTAPGRSTQSSD